MKIVGVETLEFIISSLQPAVGKLADSLQACTLVPPFMTEFPNTIASRIPMPAALGFDFYVEYLQLRCWI